MTDLTPETLAEWRKDAETDPDWREARRIIALLDALAEQQRIRVEITRTLVNPANCKVWRDGVLVFDGVSLGALAAEKAAREEAEAREGNERVQAGWEKARADENEKRRALAERRAVKAEQDAEVYHSGMLAAGAETQRLRDERNAAEARAVKAEGTVEFLLGQKDEWAAAIAKAEQESSLHKRRAEVHIERELSAKARVTALEAGINALIDMHDQRGKRINPNDLRDLTGKGADS